MTDKGFIGLRRYKCARRGPEFGPQGDETGSELNPRVWQGDCFMGIDQKRSEMFTELEGGWAVVRH